MADEDGDYIPPGGSGVGLRFRKPYTPSAGSAVGITFKYVFYHPPPGNKVGVDFSGPYTAPAGNQVGLEFSPSDEPPSQTQYAFPAGPDVLAVGTTTARNAAEIIFPGSVSSGAQVGAPGIHNRTQVASGAGAIPPRNGYGRPEVWLYTRYLKPGGADTQAHGTQWASHYLRYITAAGVGDRTERGTPWVSRSPRELAPTGFDAMKVLESHVVGGTRHIFPTGTEMTQWGTRIIPEGQVAYPQGFVGDVGAPDVQLHTRYLQASGFQANPDDLRFGRQDVWNLRQIVQQDYDPNDGLNPPGFGQWTDIENRNKTPVPVGWLSERHGYQFIWNKAVLVTPAGVSAPADPPFYQAGSVTHWRRAVAPEGLDSLAPGRWHAAFNKADVLQGHGAEQQDFGRPALENRSRLYDKVGNFDTMAVGTPMLADAIRTLSFESRYSVEPPALSLPLVKLHTRYVEYTTMGDKSGAGMPVLEIRWTYIAPSWKFHPPAWIGEPALHNVTPELRTGGKNHEEFGDTKIRTQWRYVETREGDMVLWGRPTARDRRHWVEFVTVGTPPTLLPGPVVTKIGGRPDPQYAAPWGIDVDFIGDAKQVPVPSLNQQVAYVDGFIPLRFGEAVVTANSIQPKQGIFERNYGMPTVTNKHRTVSLSLGGIHPVTECGTPGLSPNTIWAVLESPAQAKENHPKRQLHYVDHDPMYGHPLKGVGKGTMVTTINRKIFAHGFTPHPVEVPQVFRPRVQLARRTILVTGTRFWYLGIPSVGKGGTIETFGEPSSAFGKPELTAPPYTGPRYITPEGVAGASGAPRIEHLHRRLVLTGTDQFRAGASKHDDTPYQWQGLRVGPLVENIIGGVDAAEYGEPWVSLGVRDIPIEGFDAFECSYDYENFDKRMRVTQTKFGPPPQHLSPDGLQPPEPTAADVRAGRHYIRPDGNAEQYRKGAPQ